MSDLEQFVARSLNEEQTKELKDAFELFDFDGSGRINPQELRLALSTLGYGKAREEVQDIAHRFEQITTRSMTFPEFLRIVHRALCGCNPIDQINKAFIRFDDDATDRISFRNLKRASLELGEDLTDEELREMIKAADMDLDGEISHNEFLELMNRAEIF
jgi:centrin-1